jgi:hypothetical protein
MFMSSFHKKIMKQIKLLVVFFIFFSSIAVAQLTNNISNSNISNNIKLNLGKGIKLVKAYLFFDGGERLPDSNYADLNQNVNMLIQIERGGWVEKDGKVSVGASEKITTSAGTEILNEPDLFTSLTDISAEDAQYITLKAVITSMTKKISFFLVTFTVWDKWGSGKITGSYRFKVR